MRILFGVSLSTTVNTHTCTHTFDRSPTDLTTSFRLLLLLLLFILLGISVPFVLHGIIDSIAPISVYSRWTKSDGFVVVFFLSFSLHQMCLCVMECYDAVRDGVETFISFLFLLKNKFNSRALCKASWLTFPFEESGYWCAVYCMRTLESSLFLFLLFFWSHGMYWMLFCCSLQQKHPKHCERLKAREKETQVSALSCSAYCMQIDRAANMRCHVAFYTSNHFLFMFYSFYTSNLLTAFFLFHSCSHCL